MILDVIILATPTPAQPGLMILVGAWGRRYVLFR